MAPFISICIILPTRGTPSLPTHQELWASDQEPGLPVSQGPNPVSRTFPCGCQEERQNSTCFLEMSSLNSLRWSHRKLQQLREPSPSYLHLSFLILKGMQDNRLNLSGKPPASWYFKDFAMPNSTAPTAILLHPQSPQVCLSLLRKFNNSKFTSTPLACPQLNLLLQIYDGYCPFLGKSSKKIWPRHSLLQCTNTISNKCYCHHFKELHLLLKDYISRLWLSGQVANTQKEKRCCQV